MVQKYSQQEVCYQSFSGFFQEKKYHPPKIQQQFLNSIMDQHQICEIHNQPLVCFDDKQQKFLCLNCLTTKFSLMPMSEFHEKQFQKQFEPYEKSLKLLKQLSEGLELHKQKILQRIDQFFMVVSKFIKTIEEQYNILKDQFYKQGQASCQYKNTEQRNFKTYLNEVRNKLQFEMAALIEISNLQKFSEILNNMNSIQDVEEIDVSRINLEQQVEKQIVNDNLASSNIVIQKKFDYQLIEQSSYQENQYCHAIAFNKDNTLMISCSEQVIKVFEFKQDKLKEIQQLKGHKANVSCLKFLKKSQNLFISGGQEGQIIIWEQIQNNQWQSIQILTAHTSSIQTITINQNEDMLISGSYDSTIKFWQRENNTWNSKQSIRCSNIVWSVSLSNNEDKLIASISDKQILVIQLQGKEWTINQKISVEQQGLRLCFISQNQFIFQPYDRQYCLIFNFDQKEQKYKQEIQIKYQNTGKDALARSPISYLQQIGLILVKHDESVHIIKRTQNGQYIVEQSIHFGTNQLYGCITDDGRYIATWDQKSKEIQIRRQSL